MGVLRIKVGLIKHLLGSDQWLSGCVRLSIFIKAPATSEGDRVSGYCEIERRGVAKSEAV